MRFLESNPMQAALYVMILLDACVVIAEILLDLHAMRSRSPICTCKKIKRNTVYKLNSNQRWLHVWKVDMTYPFSSPYRPHLSLFLDMLLALAVVSFLVSIFVVAVCLFVCFFVARGVYKFRKLKQQFKATAEIARGLDLRRQYQKGYGINKELKH